MINDIEFYPNGDYLIGGNFTAGMDFDPALVGNGTFTGNNSVGYFAKYSASGQYLWHKLINGPSNQYVQAMSLDDSLNIIVTGAHRGNTNFDLPNTFNLASINNSDDVFIAKYDSLANLKWVKGFGLTPFTSGRGVAVDENGNIYFTGEFSGTTEFNQGGTPMPQTSNGGLDVFVASLNRNGDYRWIVPFGGPQDDRPRDLQRVGNRVFTVGDFFQTVDFGGANDTNIRESRGSNDVFVHILDTNGNYVNAISYGGIGQDFGRTLSHFQGNTFVGGQVGRNVNLSPTNFPIIIPEFGALDGMIVQFGTAGPCPPEFDTIIITECGSFTWNNETFTETGIYTRQLFTVNGCDSTVFLDITILPTYDSLIGVSTCEAGFSWMGQTLSASGMYIDTLTTLSGCDSIIRLDLELLPPSFDTVNHTACEEYTWALNNQTYSQSGFYSDTLVNANGCDSIVTLHLSILHASSGSVSITACEEYTWSVNNQIYTQSGTYIDTLQNANGCDSIITLNLTINQPTSSSVNISACEEYTWPVNNQTYTQSGTYIDTLQNANGCDSIVTLNLTINQPTSSSVNVSACEEYTWPVNNQTYTQSGTYIDTLQNANTCDSIVSLNLSINTVDISVADSVLSLTALATGASFQWLDCQDNFSPIPGANSAIFTPTVNGEYAVEITQNNCVDTSACYVINQIGVSTFNQLDIRIFPNPNTGQFTIDLGRIYPEYIIRISDAKGGIIRFFSGENSQFITQQLEVASGVYMVEIRIGSERKMMRLVIL